MYYVYILYSKKLDKMYTGSTKDLRKRLSQHNAGESGWTKRGVPWKLIYYEASLNEQDAFDREKQLKTGLGKRYVSNRLKHFLT
jgi:putative endonuclease